MMLINMNKISHHNTNTVKFVRMTDTHDRDKAFAEWYKTYTTTKYPSSIHDDFYRNNRVVTAQDWRSVYFAIRFAEIKAINEVSAMTYSRIEEETNLIEAMDNAYATEAMLVMANAIDDAWISKAKDLVALARERVDAARASEANAMSAYHTAMEKTKAIEMMEELRISEMMSWVDKMTHMDNEEKWWGFESEYY